VSRTRSGTERQLFDGEGHLGRSSGAVADDRHVRAALERPEDGGIGADVYYPMPVHRQSYIEALGLGTDLPVTDRAAARTMALPIYPGLTESDRAQVIDVVRSAVLRLADPVA